MSLCLSRHRHCHCRHGSCHRFHFAAADAEDPIPPNSQACQAIQAPPIAEAPLIARVPPIGLAAIAQASPIAIAAQDHIHIAPSSSSFSLTGVTGTTRY